MQQNTVEQWKNSKEIRNCLTTTFISFPPLAAAWPWQRESGQIEATGKQDSKICRQCEHSLSSTQYYWNLVFTDNNTAFSGWGQRSSFLLFATSLVIPLQASPEVDWQGIKGGECEVVIRQLGHSCVQYKVLCPPCVQWQFQAQFLCPFQGSLLFHWRVLYCTFARTHYCDMSIVH